MKMDLRRALVAFGLLYLVGAAVLIYLNVGGPCIAAYLTVNGLAIIAAALFERHEYRPRIRRDTSAGAGAGAWVDTGERSVHPTTGRVTRVLYNPRTGERDYVEEAQPPGKGDLPS